MKSRLTITIDDELLNRIKIHAGVAATGDDPENVSRVISDLIRANIPALS